MRWRIVRTLIVKDVLRHWADRGCVAVLVLLVAVALALSFVGPPESGIVPANATMRVFYIDFWQNDPWIEFLRRQPHGELPIEFRPLEQVPVDDRGVIVYERDQAAIQIKPNGTDAAGRTRYQLLVWYPGTDPRALTPFLAWFWKETLRHYQGKGTPLAVDAADMTSLVADVDTEIQISRANVPPLQRFLFRLPRPALTGPEVPPIEMEVQFEKLRGLLDDRTILATMTASFLVIFACCFLSVYLMPALFCEERERRLLLAQLLTPVSMRELVAAKLILYPLLATLLGALLAGVYQPRLLLRPTLWAVLALTAFGYLGVGLIIASVARTQRQASLTAMAYLLITILLVLLGQRLHFPFLSQITLEYHTPRLVHAAMSGNFSLLWEEFPAGLTLAAAWSLVGSILFCKYAGR